MTDVIVVGAGGGGPVVAKELASRGLDVLLVEAGPGRADLEHDFSHLELDANNPITGYLRFGPSDRAAPPWLRELPQPSTIIQASGVGGSTQIYFANNPRALKGAFIGDRGPEGSYDRNHPFPFTYRDLVPYYEWVEATLPVATSPVGVRGEVFLNGAMAMGLPFNESRDVTRDSCRAQPNAILLPGGLAGRVSMAGGPRFPLATGCTFCGHCAQGCMEPLGAPRNLKAKRSTNNSYVPMALTADQWSAHGRPIQLVTDAFVTRVHTRRRRGQVTATGVTWRVRGTGELVRENAKAVVLALGAVETPRLWLSSRLPDPGGWVGRGLTDHHLDIVLGVLPQTVDAAKGPGSTARCDFPGRGSITDINLGHATQAAVSAFSAAGFAGALAPRYGADSRGAIVGSRLRHMLEAFDRTLPILVMTDDDVERHNRVSLSAVLPPDEHGLVPRLEVHGRRRSRRTRDNRAFLTKRAVALSRAAGATEVHHIDMAPLELHMHSTMRMGDRPTNSVLDPTGRAWAVGGLYIADNSALSNSLGGPNPTITTQALATRTAEYLFRDVFGGDPWIRDESPVSSIDDRVTTGMEAI